MSRTLPQIIMLNHAASVNSERLKARMADKTTTAKNQNSKDPVVMGNKRLSELTTDELGAYYSSW